MPDTFSQYDEMFSHMSTDELFNALVEQYGQIICALENNKDTPDQLKSPNRDLLLALLKNCAIKSQSAPEQQDIAPYFKDRINTHDAVNKHIVFEKKLLGSMKALARQPMSDKGGKLAFIRVCDTNRQIEGNQGLKEKIISGKDFLLQGKSPIKKSQVSYIDSNGTKTTQPVLYDSRYSTQTEAYEWEKEKIRREEEVKGNGRIQSIEFKDEKQANKNKNQENQKKKQANKNEDKNSKSTYALKDSQIRGGTCRI